MVRLKKSWIVLMVAGATLVRAQGYQVNLQGQAQQGMGSAGTAYVQDGAALFYNPGGISFLQGNTINAGVSPTISKGLFLEKSTGAKAETESPTSFPFAVYAVFQVKDSTRLKLGFGIYTPFGSTVQWKNDWMGRFILTRLQLQTIFMQPTVSYKINDKLGIGAGFVFATGHVNLQKDLPIADANGNFAHAELNGTTTGYGFNAGIYFKPVEKFSIGLSYRSQVNMKVDDGDATFTVPPSLSASFPNGKFKSKLPLPQVATLGFAFMPNARLALALDVNYVGWKAYDTLAFDYTANTTALADTRSARRYKDAFSFRLGGQYRITNEIMLRLGVAYCMTPVQSGYVTPETPDANRINYTIGIGYMITKNLGMNASFLFTTLKRADTNMETKLSGTYKTNVYAPGVALFYNF